MRNPSTRPFMEMKNGVRRVRTPSGAEKYGQPIGSIIVRDILPEGLGKIRNRADRLASREPDTAMALASAGPQKVESEYLGWDKYKIGRTAYYLGKEDGKWLVTDKDDNILFEGPTKTSGRSHLDSLAPVAKAPAPRKTATPAKKPLVKMHVATDEDRKNFVANGGSQPIPPAWTDVRIADNLATARLQATGKDAKGRSQSVYSAEHTEGAAAAKYTRIKAMAGQIHKLDDHLEQMALTNDAAAAILLMRELGMRPDTGGEGGEYQSYGALSLEKRHVKVTSGGKVTLQFRPGKKKGPDYIEDENGKQIKNPKTWVTMTTTNPLVAEMLRDRLDKQNGKSMNTPLLNTNPSQVNKMMKDVMGDEFKVKDLRTLKANVMALDFIQKKKRPALPRTKAEFKKWRNDVGDYVSEALGNDRTMALNSYINPAVFAKWEAAVS